jgi:hypothetical protein
MQAISLPMHITQEKQVLKHKAHASTENQLVFTCEKLLQGLQELHLQEYFSPRIRYIWFSHINEENSITKITCSEPVYHRRI